MPETKRQNDPLQRIQCNVAKVALYALPGNLKLDSIDFEQCILECIKNKLDDRMPDTGFSKRIINEIQIQTDLLLTTDVQQLIQPNNNDINDNSNNNNDNIENNDSINNQNHNHLDYHLNYAVSIQKNKLIWTVMPKLEPIPADIRECNCYLQTCFDDIKLCYVNYQMPNLIIWLILSVPKRVVKKTDEQTGMVTKYCDASNGSTSPPRQQKMAQLKQDSLFALVWKCFGEQDVVKLREVYKYLQSLKRLNQVDFLQNDSLSSSNVTTTAASAAITLRRLNTSKQKQKRSDETNQIKSSDHLPNKMIDNGNEVIATMVPMKLSSNRSALIMHSNSTFCRQTYEQMMLSRQRQPARIIQERSSSAINLKLYLETFQQQQQQQYQHQQQVLQQQYHPQKCDITGNYRKKSIDNIFKHLNKSESEFDTTQINLYLKQKRFSTQRSNGYRTGNNTTRSRSVDSSKQTIELLKDVAIGNVFPVKTLASVNSRENGHNNNSNSNNRYNKPEKINLIRSFVDLLNSEGSSISDESSSGEFNDLFNDESFVKSDSTPINIFAHHNNNVNSNNNNNDNNNNNGSHNKTEITNTVSSNTLSTGKKPPIMKSVLKKPNEDSNRSYNNNNNHSHFFNLPHSLSYPPTSAYHNGTNNNNNNNNHHNHHYGHHFSSFSILADRFRFGSGGRNKSNANHHSSSLSTNLSLSNNNTNNNNNNNNNHNTNCNKKNVTFSAYATIQMVDT